MRSNWNGLLTFSPEATVRDALEAIDSSAVGAVVIVDDARRVAGIITDGDCRRHFLRGGRITDQLSVVMTSDPLVVESSMPRVDVLEMMKARGISVIPIVSGGHYEGVHLLREIIGGRELPNYCVILAGGRGTRLGAITEHLPKPMVEVAGRPILERIVLHAMSFGIRKFVISVGYLADVIEAYFGDGRAMGCEIEYVRDLPGTSLGTAGCLSMLRQEIYDSEHAVVVMNGDLITDFDLQLMIDHHQISRSMITVGANTYRHQVPFGVLLLNEDGSLIAIEEKPEATWQVSAGVNVISPEVLGDLEYGKPLMMTELFDRCIAQSGRVTTFEIGDRWADLGTPLDLQKARGSHQ